MSKTCVICGENKSLEEFHRKQSSPDGRRNDCKECRKVETQKRLSKHRDRLNKEKREWYRKTKESREERNSEASKVASKRCPDCGEDKPPTDFYFRSNGGLQNICKKCWCIASEKYASENIERTRELKRIREQRRRSRIKNLPNEFDDEDWKECLTYFGHRCAYCGDSDDSLTQDHVIAVSKGGGYTKDNIIPACFSCNTRKHNRDMESWFRDQGYFCAIKLRKIDEYLAKYRTLN